MVALSLPTVTLCAVTSVNVEATLAALRACLDQAEFADCLLLTDAHPSSAVPGIRIVPIERLGSADDYSRFILEKLVDHVATAHCLVVQWDGFVIDARGWDAAFLDFDYIGAPWPQFADRHAVGNGGFSLRSRRLLAACSDPAFKIAHPEDVAICRTNRALLESAHDIRFADAATAARFAFERGARASRTFGFHGVFNMVPLLGADRFWAIYRTLDDASTAFVDFFTLFGQIGKGRSALKRRARLIVDRLLGLFGR